MAEVSDLRIKLLEWVNDVLEFQYNKADHYTKVEQLGTGVAYCYIIDTIYGDVQLSKLKLNTKHERAYTSNFNVLRRTFDKHKIDKDIPVDLLVKCRFQDNLEFLQWLKSFWDGKNMVRYEDVTVNNQKASGLVTYQNPFTSTSTSANININTSNDQNMNASGSSTDTNLKQININNKRNSGAILSSSSSSSSAVSTSQQRAASSKIMELNQKVSQLQTTIKILQEENQLYFSKLESIKRAILKSHTLKYAKPGSLVNTLKKIDNILFSEKAR